MKLRPKPGDYDPYYQLYIEKVIEWDLLEALKFIHTDTQSFLLSIPEEKGSFRYAEGKWSISEVINHLMDCERIIAYRALRFARKDYTDLPGFDENAYAPNANAERFTLAELAKQFQNIRTCTIDLFTSFTESMLDEKGPANGSIVSVLALGYIITGHEVHHLGVIRDRYL